MGGAGVGNFVREASPFTFYRAVSNKRPAVSKEEPGFNFRTYSREREHRFRAAGPRSMRESESSEGKRYRFLKVAGVNLPGGERKGGGKRR